MNRKFLKIFIGLIAGFTVFGNSGVVSKAADVSNSDNFYNDLCEHYRQGTKISRAADASETDDYLDFNVGLLRGAKGGVSYLADGCSFYETGEEKPDPYVHFELLKSSKNSAFDGVDRVCLEVQADGVNDDAKGDVLRTFLNFKRFDESKIDVKAANGFDVDPNKKYFKSDEAGNKVEHMPDEKFLSERKNAVLDYVKNNYSGKFELCIPQCELEKGAPVDGIYVGNFLKRSEREFLNEKTPQLQEPIVRTCTFKFYIDDNVVDGHVIDKNSYAKLEYYDKDLQKYNEEKPKRLLATAKVDLTFYL